MKYLNSNDHFFLIMDKGYFPYGKKSKEFLFERIFEYEEEKSKSKYQNGGTLSEIFKLFK